jgi:hypothetical protein
LEFCGSTGADLTLLRNALRFASSGLLMADWLLACRGCRSGKW